MSAVLAGAAGARRRAPRGEHCAANVLSWPADGWELAPLPVRELPRVVGCNLSCERTRSPSRTALSCNSTHFLPLLAKLGHAPQKRKAKQSIRFPLVDGAEDASEAVPAKLAVRH